MKFGIDLRHKKTGADIYVIAFQIVSLLAPVYIFWSSGYTSFLGRRNFLTVLFDFGVCALPRWEAFLLSFVYRAFSSELAPYFLMLFIALVLGIASSRFLRGNKRLSFVLHYIFSALIIADLIFRLLPFGINSQFSLPICITAFLFRFLCLALLVSDIIFDRRGNRTDRNK